MNGRVHKAIGIIVFIILFLFNLFPKEIMHYLSSSKENLAYSLIIAIVFSGGRINNKKWYDFGLSPDNDFHKKNDRSWIMHSAILPTIAIYLSKNPIILIASFFYSFHIAVDLINVKSWKYISNYIIALLTTILFFIVLYQQNF